MREEAAKNSPRPDRTTRSPREDNKKKSGELVGLQGKADAQNRTRGFLIGPAMPSPL